MSSKSIDINQRIPLDTLHTGLVSFLNNQYSNDYMMEQLRLEYTGGNRLKKALRIVNRIIPKNPLITLVQENSAAILSAMKRSPDRDVILIALLNSAFPFSYDVLQTFGKYFFVQEIVNTETIIKAISGVYGGNRSTQNGIYSVVPMFLEANFFKRPKQGLSEWKDTLMTSAPITKQLYLESFKYNHSLAEIQGFQLMEPYFLFLEMDEI